MFFFSQENAGFLNFCVAKTQSLWCFRTVQSSLWAPHLKLRVGIDLRCVETIKSKKSLLNLLLIFMYLPEMCLTLR